MSKKVRVVHYLNQFFAQIGGEEKAGVGPGFKAGPVGPGRALEREFGVDGEVVATIYCGDNYFAEHESEVIDQLLAWVSDAKADLLIAGPAFESGRYGLACGAICRAAVAQLGIAALAGMDESNAGAALYRRSVYIFNSGPSVVRMTAVVARMVKMGIKLARGVPLGQPEQEGYIARGIKRNKIAAKAPAERAVDMLLTKLRGEAVQTEILPPRFTAARTAPPLRELSSAKIALVTDGGLVIEGNPEKMEPGRPTRFTAIPVMGLDRLDPGQFDVVHSGFDTRVANQDPHRLVPLDSLRELEKGGVIGGVYEVIHATGGAHAEVENAVRIGRSIAERLKAAGVDGVILTST